MALATNKIVFTMEPSLVPDRTLGRVRLHCNRWVTEPASYVRRVSVLPQPATTQTLRSSSDPRGPVRDSGAVNGCAPDPGRAAAGAFAAASWVATPGGRGNGETGAVENAGSDVGEIMGRRLRRMAE